MQVLHKLICFHLKTVYPSKTFDELFNDRKSWGRIYESTVGAHILSHAHEGDYKVWYWRDHHDNEVDYVMEKKGKFIAIEVKSNDNRTDPGLSEFRKRFNPYMRFVAE